MNNMSSPAGGNKYGRQTVAKIHVRNRFSIELSKQRPPAHETKVKILNSWPFARYTRDISLESISPSSLDLFCCLKRSVKYLSS
jgi:hypothetical protein